MEDKYFRTKSKSFAYAIQYITNQRFYKFQDENNTTHYSFIITDGFYNKVKALNDIKFN